MKKFLVIDRAVLPQVYEKVLEVKELVRMNEVKSVSSAISKVGISRSTFYKYKDFVFSLSDSSVTQKASIHLMLKHESGVLAEILKILAEKKANVLTINQNIPINRTADVSITFDLQHMDVDIDHLLNQFKELEGVLNAELLALE